MAAPTVKDNNIVLNDGYLMPILGLGTWQSPPEQVTDAVECALKNGYKLIDTAYAYVNEEAVGKGLQKWAGKREDVFVTTKLPSIGMKAEMVRKCLKLSLKKLGLDYVDLYLVHSPVGFQYVDDDTLASIGEDGNIKLDYGTDLIAIWKEMEVMKKEGLAKSIGVSNFSVPQLRKVVAAGSVPPAVNQVEMHVEYQQKDLETYCRGAGIALTSYGTFGSPGRKGTPMETNTTVPNLLENPVVSLVAENHHVSPAQVLLRYFIAKGVAVIPKSVTPSRIIDNAKVLSLELSETETNALETLDKGAVGCSFLFLKQYGMELHPECPFYNTA